ncbi:MAG: MBL fold metallo-hydrolase [Patescibacteria group bacterium]
MILTYLGQETFKIQFGDLTIALNPPSKDSSFKTGKFGADVVLQSIIHEDMNGGKDYSYGEREPFVISGPGEYETKGVFVRGVEGESNYDGEKRINTIYSFTVDGISMLFLGAQSGPLPTTISEIIDTVDLLFIPIGGNGVYDAKEAYKIAMNLEPKIIVPMHFKDVKDDSLKAFLKEASETSVEPLDKLTIKRKDVEGKEGEVVVLIPQS